MVGNILQKTDDLLDIIQNIDPSVFSKEIRGLKPWETKMQKAPAAFLTFSYFLYETCAH